jgi:glucosamine--fructose-6-phosphate aminotransferase (isomerizing)
MPDSDTFYDSIMQQPGALRDLAACTQGADGLQSLPLAEKAAPLVFTGMGASYHAASIAAHALHAAGIPALCLEATDLLFFSPAILKAGSTLVFVSQSGASGEVRPILAQLPQSMRLVAVVNDRESALAQRADVLLPMCAGVEKWVATKTYSNALAALWLLVRRLTGAWDGSEMATLHALADEVARLLTDTEAIRARWIETLDGASTLVFLGHGAQAITARQAAMMANEWAKLPAAAYSAGAFRHGFIEQVRHDSAAVLFAAQGPAYDSTLRLADELASYGARVLLVEGGRTRAVGEAAAPVSSRVAADPMLAAMLDVLPAQLFAEAMARHLNIPYGFRHIGKVVTQL